MVVVFRCSSNTQCRDATKSTNPRKMLQKNAGVVEGYYFKWPRNSSSKAPQNFTQSVIFDKICLSMSTSSLCFLTANLYPSSSCAAMLVLPCMASLTALNMCTIEHSCFLICSDIIFRSLTPVTVHVVYVPSILKSKHRKHTTAVAKVHPVDGNQYKPSCRTTSEMCLLC